MLEKSDHRKNFKKQDTQDFEFLLKQLLQATSLGASCAPRATAGLNVQLFYRLVWTFSFQKFLTAGRCRKYILM